MDLKQILSTILEQGGNELHLKVGSPPLMRQNKFLKRLKFPSVMREDIDGVVEGLLSAEDRKKYASQRFFEVNFFGKQPCNFRLNVFQVQSEPCVIIRLIRKAVPTFAEIGFPMAMEPLTTAASGLMILAGPSRSGISTSLAAFLERINQTRPAHILIIEDPIEFYFEPKKARISQRQFKKDLPSVEAGINFAKRMDVDILVIGDLKREVPFRNILDYVAGGHFVILSMMTLGVQNTLEKILLSFPETDRDHVCNVLAHNLLGICSQALLLNPIDKKMIPVHEVMITNNPMRGIIQKGRINQVDPNIKTAGEGSQLFDQDVGRHLRDGSLPREATEGFLAMYRSLKG